jgi:hypothetical protein
MTVQGATNASLEALGCKTPGLGRTIQCDER